MKTSYLMKQLAGALVFFSVLFFSAGRIDYLQGWIYVGLGLIMFVLNYTYLKPDHDLLAERSKPGEGAKSWDKALLGISFLLTISMYIVAGLDSGRYFWSPEFHLSLYLTGFILTASGQLLFLIAQKQNKFFSSTVRIQTDREHTVCDTGLYKFVRHPAYMGSVIQLIGFPLLMGSVWSLIPVCLLLAVHITRTALEDITLKKELKGYNEYSSKIRYRIIPFIW